MSQETLRFILQILAVFLGGGSVQLVVLFIRRKSELRQLDTSSDVNVAVVAEKKATAQDRLIDQLQEDGTAYRETVRELQTKMERLEDRATAAQREFTAQLRDAHHENARLATRIAQLTTDVDIAHRQIDELRRRHPGGL